MSVNIQTSWKIRFKVPVLSLEMFLQIKLFYHQNAFIADQTVGNKKIIPCPIIVELLVFKILFMFFKHWGTFCDGISS